MPAQERLEEQPELYKKARQPYENISVIYRRQPASQGSNSMFAVSSLQDFDTLTVLRICQLVTEVIILPWWLMATTPLMSYSHKAERFR